MVANAILPPAGHLVESGGKEEEEQEHFTDRIIEPGNTGSPQESRNLRKVQNEDDQVGQNQIDQGIEPLLVDGSPDPGDPGTGTDLTS